MVLRQYLARKVGIMVLTMLLIVSLNFFMIQVLPGDPAKTILPRGSGPSNMTNQGSLITQLHQEWGLDQPLPVRFLVYMGNILRGNWGTSITYQPGHSVWEVIAPRLVTTLSFTGIATLISIWLGLRIGVFTGWRWGRRSDSALALTSLIAYSLPTYWIGIALILGFAVYLPILPASGVSSPPNVFSTLDPLGQLEDLAVHAILPLSAFVLNNFGIFGLIMRTSVAEQLGEDYVVTAEAKGLRPRNVLRGHVLPNARLPVVTTIALYLGWVLSGAIVIEVVFNLNGVGRLTWEAVQQRDYPLMSAIFLLGALGVVIANTITDVLYSYLDPRVTEA